MVQRWFNYSTKALRAVTRRGALFLLVSLMASSLIVTVLPAKSVVAQDGVGPAISTLIPGLASNNCNVATIGWVLCPTMRSIAQIADRSFAFIDQDFLKLKFGQTSTDRKTEEAWRFIQGIANVFLVAVFLYIIYNYLVGRTGGAYSLKRQLPRMVIIVILIQASYFISIIFVEISNIVGDSIWQIMKGVLSGATPILPLGQTVGPLASDGVLTRATIGVMGGFTPWALFPIAAVSTISIALISSATIVLVFMREAVVATLIIASPVLIVFYLLPNLERFSSQAMRLFFQLLVLYPIVALLLGTGQIISLGAGSWDGGSAATFVASSIAVLPLLATWFLFKNISTAMDMAGARMSASISSRRGGQDDKEARVTGKATAGASAMKNSLGFNPNGPNRKQSFSRNRRRASLADTTLLANGSGSRKETGKRGGVQEPSEPGEPRDRGVVPTIISDVAPSGPPLADGGLSAANASMQGGVAGDIDGALKASADTADIGAINPDVTANVANQPPDQPGSFGNKMMTAVLGAKGREKDDDKKPVTAKDLFSSMNRGMGHESKDKQRSFSSGPGPAGAPAGAGNSQGGAPTMGPVTNYAAPSMAQSANIIGGSAAGSQTPIQAVAVPVAVDASSLLQTKAVTSIGNPTSPVIGTQKDAEARANKYLFDAQRDINEARDAEEVLGHKRDETFEPPHTIVQQSELQDQDDKK